MDHFRAVTWRFVHWWTVTPRRPAAFAMHQIINSGYEEGRAAAPVLRVHSQLLDTLPTVNLGQVDSSALTINSLTLFYQQYFCFVVLFHMFKIHEVSRACQGRTMGSILPKIAKIRLNNRCRICCKFNRCQYVVVTVQQCSLLHGYAITAQRHISYPYHRPWPAKI